MIPLTLTLTGFKGIRDGLGRESITINFADLPEGSELIAITGRNGRGKSTILDNMTPYPVMPSRAGADGLGAFSYYEEVYLPENFKELIWEQNGIRYRSQIVIRDQGRRKTEAYLHEDFNGRWRPAKLPDGTLSDGRLETYLQCVEGIAGNSSTFLTTAFSAQSRRQLATYRNAEIKSLLADLLGLDRIRALGEQANETVRLIRSGLLSLRQSRASLQNEQEKTSAMLQNLGDVERQIETARRNRRIASERHEACRADLAKLTAKREMNATHEERRAQLQEERLRALDRTQTAMSHLETLERAGREGLSRLRQRTAQRCAQRDTNAASLRAQITGLQRTIQSGRHVKRAVLRQARLKPVIERRAQAVENWQRMADQVAQLRSDLALKRSEMSSIEREAGQAALAERDLRRRFGLTSEVPCAGMALQKHCKLLGDARAAQPLIPDASAKIARLDKARQALHTELAQINEQLVRLASVESTLKLAKAKRCRTEARLSWECQLAARQADIAQAHASLTTAEAQLGALMSQLATEQGENKTEEATLQAQLEDLVRRRDQETRKCKTEVDRIDSLTMQLPPPFDDASLARAVSATAQASAFLESAESALEAANAAMHRHAVLQQSLETNIDQCAALDRQIEQVEREIARWTLFAKCMGNDGIIALAVDDAGPELSLRANQLLLACYGPRFTVSIKTQLATAKGDLKEGFEITVHDAWRNTSKSVGKMSGGERIWINECLTRAMALYLAEASERRSSTLFSDEADGAFDVHHKRQFMAMKREVLRIGGYRQEFFISHTPELSEMADAVIDLDQYAVGEALSVV